ncbi:hypothetical protein JVU11DRAFT_7456 [Chiua virens]|nr:hypothetical protein JVU11DRAFT_7456 [Chiua virens]
MNPQVPPKTERTLEILEETFRRVEQASERRALDEPELEQTDSPRKYHKKGGVSVSQFGKVTISSPEFPHFLNTTSKSRKGTDNVRASAPSPLSAAAAKSTFYHTLANAHTGYFQPRSVESMASENLEEETPQTEEEHEIQVERIAGRQTLPKTVGALLPRRLTRAQSHHDYVSITRGMVIDVSVETTTESSQSSPNMQTSTAYATRPSRLRAATVGTIPIPASLVERAKDFARKLRGKGRTDLP